MPVPEFLLSRVYKRGSLRQTGAHQFAFDLHNVLADVTIVGPPRIEVNGFQYAPHQVEVEGLDVARIGPAHPYRFGRGARLTVRLPGEVMLGGNRIRLQVRTRELGDVEVYAEDRAQMHCPLPRCAVAED